MPIVCDVREPDSVAALFAVVKTAFRQESTFWSTMPASRQPPVPVEETSLEMWRDIIDTNLTGVFLCTRAALPLMHAGATIINNLSAAAKQVFPNYATYSAAKTRRTGLHAVAARRTDPARHSRDGADAGRDLDRHVGPDHARRSARRA